jgi:protoporphyrinogen oxidase
MRKQNVPHVVIIGAGFCGLAAGFELSQRGVRVTLLEQAPEIGGLAGSFHVMGERLEKFYHHWFTNDEYIPQLVKELGTQQQILFRPAKTGMYFAHNFFKLSTPLDLLRFTPLSVIDRLRLGFLALRVRRVADWHELEELSAVEWLKRMGGEKVYEVVWEPLLRGKFGDIAPEISAVWFWNKLKLRGGSRGKKGEEQLAYYRGGFSSLAEQIATHITQAGGQVRIQSPVNAITVNAGRVTGVETNGEYLAADGIIATPALPIVADLLAPHVAPTYVTQLRRIRYLANVCLVLELDRKLSDTYWLNVNDPQFPFVGVIEHTNFEPVATYSGRHIVYLSKYLPATDPFFALPNHDLLVHTLPALQRMFPAFQHHWILDFHVWRARYAQPIVERRYNQLIPPHETPLAGLYIASMAQIYPEDRGTNYAIREGRKVARLVSQFLHANKRPI